ncbi:MAG TPA: LysM peptidoglycan-binding domain-containing protein [Planctomycetaceae bacterium]|nr:LysM peptidoglycan-binding domain-containing protein [Planctomycetaceae bacterium]
MHRDKKLGLGLGILLVGVVAAFFFRHEPAATPPALHDAERLDRRIADKDVTPYPDPAAGRPANAAPPPAPPRTPADDAWALPDFLRDPGTPAATSAGPAPNPVPDAAGQLPLARGGTGPAHNQAWRAPDKPNGPQPNRNEQSPAAAASADGIVLHRVVQGDTLSGLAARYLGSSARFLEIYEANRNVLRSPNDLRVGMTLRIPTVRQSTPRPGDAARTVRISETESRPTDSPADSPATPAAGPVRPAIDQRERTSHSPPTDSTDGAEPRRRFTPVRRSPLLP